MSVTALGYDVANPVSALTAAEGSGSGSLDLAANYLYKVSYLTNFGETLVGPASVAAQTTTGKMALTAIPVSTNPEVHSRNIYRTVGGGSTYLLLAVIDDNSTTTYTDTTADASLGAAVPAANTAGSREIIKGTLALTNPLVESTSTGLTALAGGAQVGATLLASTNNIVSTVATANDSTILPLLSSSSIGMVVNVTNAGANSMRVYPAVGQFIAPGGADVPVVVAAGVTATYTATSATTWTQASPAAGSGSLGFGSFHVIAAGGTVAIGGKLDFSSTSVSGGKTPITRSGAGDYVLPAVGTYDISWQAAIAEAGQLELSSSATGVVAYSVAGRAAVTGQICNRVLFTSTVANEVISVLNPAGNVAALTLTANAGGAASNAATLVITRIA